MTRGLKFYVTIKWNEHDQKWFMISTMTERFLYEFFDCENMHRFFKGINTEKPMNYELQIRSIEEEEELR